ncbi:unnamed protein product, partial [marine sediment metagenome]
MLKTLKITLKERDQESEEEDYLVDQDTAFGEDKLDKRANPAHG